MTNFVLRCPECDKYEKLAVSSRFGNNDYPYIVNCPRCGKFEIDKLMGLGERQQSRLEEHDVKLVCQECGVEYIVKVPPFSRMLVGSHYCISCLTKFLERYKP